MQVAFTAGGAGGKPRHSGKLEVALLLVAGWATVLVFVAMQIQAGGDAGG